MNKKSTLLKMVVMTLGLGLVTGCATTEQMQQMRADVTRAQETADAALAAAESAKGVAADAQHQAGSALVSANQAQRTAVAASAAADRCKEKCSRMMKKVLAK